MSCVCPLLYARILPACSTWSWEESPQSGRNDRNFKCKPTAALPVFIGRCLAGLEHVTDPKANHHPQHHSSSFPAAARRGPCQSPCSPSPHPPLASINSPYLSAGAPRTHAIHTRTGYSQGSLPCAGADPHNPQVVHTNNTTRAPWHSNPTRRLGCCAASVVHHPVSGSAQAGSHAPAPQFALQEQLRFCCRQEVTIKLCRINARGNKPPTPHSPHM